MSDTYTLNHTGPEIDELLGAVPDKQNKLIAGEGIEIDEELDIIKSTGAVVYANPLFPSSN